MALKSLVWVFLMITGMAGPMAEGQLGIISGILGLTKIQGTLFCTANGNINGTATPVFPNALVQLQCGNTIVSSATTNGSGIFSIVLDSVQYVLSFLLSNCNLVVRTPLSGCDVTLPSVGGLLSSLQPVGNSLLGLLNIINLIPYGFQYNVNIRN